MIVKYFQANKINLNQNKIILLYGNNDGFKKETIKDLIDSKNILHYDQNEILENENNFHESLNSKSLFDDENNNYKKGNG